MSQFTFPSSWDGRAFDAMSYMVDLELEHDQFEGFFEETIENQSSLGFVGELVLASCFMFDSDALRQLPKFSEYCDSTSEVWNVLKHSVSYAQKVMKNYDLLFTGNDRSPAGALHKALAALLFGAVLDLEHSSRLSLKNDASEFTLTSDGTNLCVTFNLDGYRDGGAATLTTVFLQMANNQIDSEWTSQRYSNFVSERYCAGLEVLSNFKELDQYELLHRLTAFYSVFRSVGPLDIEFLPDYESPWNFVLNSLAEQQNWLQVRINPGQGKYPENLSDF